MKNIGNLLDNIGNNIRVLRKAQKISQAKMAASIGLSLSQYGRMETGVANASIATVIKIASHLGIGIDLLVYGQEVKPETEQIELKEKALIEKMKELEGLKAGDKKLAHQVLDLIIAKKKLDKLVTQIHKSK